MRAAPSVYLAILCAAFVGACFYNLRTNGIYACPAAYPDGGYLGYCNSTGYGDYDHGAFWFGLEPAASRAAAEAQVLFLGSSRMEFALSTAATDAWFAANSARYYLLGFTHSGNRVFTEPLLARLSPSARIYVIDSEDFFTRRESPPVARIFHGTDVDSQYRRKKLWQYAHRIVCGPLAFVCGDTVAYYRIRATGAWRFIGNVGSPTGVSDAADEERDGWQEAIDLAHSFVSKLPAERGCILLTIAPSHETHRARAAAIAESLGIAFVAPSIPDLKTFDGAHLDRQSAERWAAAFFDAAGPQIAGCLQQTATRSSAGSR
jgi:hypothetical protein